MVVAIRLARMGHTHRAVYRLSVADSRRAPTQKFIEHVGTYDPHPDKRGHKQLRLNIARIKYWLGAGAQPSTTVARLLARFHLIPSPPIPIDVPTTPVLNMVLAGDDVRHIVPKPGQPITDLAPPPHEGTQRRLQPLDDRRVAQLQGTTGRWKLKPIAITLSPTPAIQQAWNMARVFHKQIPANVAGLIPNAQFAQKAQAVKK